MVGRKRTNRKMGDTYMKDKNTKCVTLGEEGKGREDKSDGSGGVIIIITIGVH